MEKKEMSNEDILDMVGILLASKKGGIPESDWREVLGLINDQFFNGMYLYHSYEYKGVRQYGSDQWVSRLYIYGKQKHLGTFDDEHEAAQAYNEAVFERDGFKAKLNIVPGQYKTHV